MWRVHVQRVLAAIAASATIEALGFLFQPCESCAIPVGHPGREAPVLARLVAAQIPNDHGVFFAGGGKLHPVRCPSYCPNLAGVAREEHRVGHIALLISMDGQHTVCAAGGQESRAGPCQRPDVTVRLHRRWKNHRRLQQSHCPIGAGNRAELPDPQHNRR